VDDYCTSIFSGMKPGTGEQPPRPAVD
jgi:hypothetical protein